MVTVRDALLVILTYERRLFDAGVQHGVPLKLKLIAALRYLARGTRAMMFSMWTNERCKTLLSC